MSLTKFEDKIFVDQHLDDFMKFVSHEKLEGSNVFRVSRDRENYQRVYYTLYWILTGEPHRSTFSCSRVCQKGNGGCSQKFAKYCRHPKDKKGVFRWSHYGAALMCRVYYNFMYGCTAYHHGGDFEVIKKILGKRWDMFHYWFNNMAIVDYKPNKHYPEFGKYIDHTLQPVIFSIKDLDDDLWARFCKEKVNERFKQLTDF